MKVIYKILIAIVTVVGMAVLNIAMIAGLIILQQFVLIPKEYLIWVINPPTDPLIFPIMGLADFYIIAKVSGYLRLFKHPIPVPLSGLFSKHKLVSILLLVVVFYIVFPNATSFTEDSITYRTFYNPLGTEYSYNDVHSVDVGVYGESKLFGQSEGEYFYVVTFNDGTTVDLTRSGGENTDDTYSMLEYIDVKLMDLGVEKESSLDHINLLTLDQYYIDRYVRIIVNK